MQSSSLINVDVVYANSEGYKMVSLALPLGSTIEQAILQSGILQSYPEIDLTQNRVGIFGALKTLQTEVQSGDQIEIYRALLQSAMKARELRAKAQKKQLRQQQKVIHRE